MEHEGSREKEGRLPQMTDLERITALHERIGAGGALTKEDLAFLYKDFGRDKDPRVDVLRAERNTDEDISLLFDCEPTNIARTPDAINETTRVYVGALEIGIFALIAEHNIEHVYAAFPESRVRVEVKAAGGKTKEELKTDLTEKRIGFKSAEFMVDADVFVTTEDVKDVTFVTLSVRDMRVEGKATTDAVFARAKELGLELVSAEESVHYRLQTLEQEANDWSIMGMRQITDPATGRECIFRAERQGDDLLLVDRLASPGKEWFPSFKFTFRLRSAQNKANP